MPGYQTILTGIGELTGHGQVCGAAVVEVELPRGTAVVVDGQTGDSQRVDGVLQADGNDIGRGGVFLQIGGGAAPILFL